MDLVAWHSQSSQDPSGSQAMDLEDWQSKTVEPSVGSPLKSVWRDKLSLDRTQYLVQYVTCVNSTHIDIQSIDGNVLPVD